MGIDSRVVEALGNGLAGGSAGASRSGWAPPGRGQPGRARGVYHNDHITAERYRETLAEVNGTYFPAEPLRDETGDEAGVVFGYQGTLSWVLIRLAGIARLRALRGGGDRRGRRLDLGLTRVV